jgi:hypothetical protein
MIEEGIKKQGLGEDGTVCFPWALKTGKICLWTETEFNKFNASEYY